MGALLLGGGAPARAQRVLGLDVSYWQGEITQSGWNQAFSTGNRKFVMIRSSRGGTTGLDQPQGTPGGGSTATLSHRYDDSRFVQNMVRANSAGLFTSPYHFARPDVAGNTGTDEADHFMQAAGAWMRPGYLPPMYDLEAGSALGSAALAQFSLDFSNRIYEVMQIRPSIYINGNYSNILQGASSSLRNQLAQPASNTPSVVGPAYSMLVNARYPNGSGQPFTGDLQNENPKDTAATFYGPWDDYGVAQPWSVWQYSSGEAIPGLADTTVDGDVAHGDIEYVKDLLIPAVWWNDTGGDWSALANWNSGQPVVAPIIPADQATPFAPTSPLPTARLPGAAGSGPAAGSNDTVILERPNANITVTLSTGTHNIRKIYMREALNITGGSLTINYDPKYYLVADPDYETNPDFPNAVHSGSISAQFSGPVSLSGTGSLSVHTLQVDNTRTFTLGGGTLTFNTINLMPHASTPAKIVVTGNVNFNPLSNASASIAKGLGSGNSGLVDLGGGNRALNVANGTAVTDLTISVPITNGALTKSGAGTLALNGVNTYAGDTTIQAGKLSLGSAFLANAADVYLLNGSTLELNFAGGPDIIDSLFFDGVSQAAGTWGAAGSGAQFTSPFFSGTGLLQVTTFIPPPLYGDYDSNGVVDATDFILWRNGVGPLANDATAGIQAADYDVWRANYGKTIGSGSSLAVVPEPAGGALLIAAGFLLMGWRRYC